MNATETVLPPSGPPAPEPVRPDNAAVLRLLEQGRQCLADRERKEAEEKAAEHARYYPEWRDARNEARRALEPLSKAVPVQPGDPPADWGSRYLAVGSRQRFQCWPFGRAQAGWVEIGVFRGPGKVWASDGFVAVPTRFTRRSDGTLVGTEYQKADNVAEAVALVDRFADGYRQALMMEPQSSALDS